MSIVLRAASNYLELAVEEFSRIIIFYGCRGMGMVPTQGKSDRISSDLIAW